MGGHSINTSDTTFKLRLVYPRQNCGITDWGRVVHHYYEHIGL